MNVNDIFYRRDIIVESLDLGYESIGIIDPNMSNRIMESLDLDYLPLTEGIGSKISNAFKKIKDAVIKFFKNLINKIKDFYKKIRKIDNEPAPTKNGKPAPTKNGKIAPTKNGKIAPTKNGKPAPTKKNEPALLPEPKNIKMRASGYRRGWLNREYIVQRGEKSDIKLENPIMNPQPYGETSNFLQKIASMVEDFLDELLEKGITDINVYKQEAFKYLGINSAGGLKNKIHDELYINKPIYQMKDVDFNTFFDYIDKSEETIKLLSEIRSIIIGGLDSFEREIKRQTMDEENIDSKTYYAEGTGAATLGSKYVIQIALNAVNLTMTEFSKLVSTGVRLARMVR